LVAFGGNSKASGSAGNARSTKNTTIDSRITVGIAPASRLTATLISALNMYRHPRECGDPYPSSCR
jgi:hypothetical protein